MAPSVSNTGERRRDSERIERPSAAGQAEIDRHDQDGHDGEGGGQRDVARGALVDVDRPADKEAGVAEGLRDDVVA